MLVSGRVQGVWFRETCRQEAEAVGVAGWVRNRWDGRVEAVFEGEPGPVQAMVTWCRLGPPRADVTDVEVIGEEPEGTHGFLVVR